MYTDDTSIYCVSDTIEHVTALLNNVLDELFDWYRANSFFPHPKKCEAMSLYRGNYIGPLNTLRLGEQSKELVTHSRLLGVTIDNKLSLSRHILEVKKAFANKLNLIKRSRFLPKRACRDNFARPYLCDAYLGWL